MYPKNNRVGKPDDSKIPLSSSKSTCEYMQLVASVSELIYFHDGFVEGFMIVDAIVPTGLGINLY